MIKLLIVDDEKNTREGLRKSIPWRQMNIGGIYEAQNGNEALKLVDMEKPDIILCDVRMPKMDGIELSRRAKAIYPQCKIIFLSGYSDKEYLLSAIKLGAVDYIEKPVRINELVAVIEKTAKLCCEEKINRDREQQVQNNMNGTKSLLEQELVLKLLYDASNINTQSFACECLPDFLDGSTGFTAAIMYISGNNRPSIGHEVCVSIRSWIDTKGHDYNFKWICAFHNDTNILLIFNQYLPPVNYSDSGLNRFFQKAGRIVEAGGCRCAIGIGKPVVQYQVIPVSYENAAKAIEKRFFRGFGSIIASRDEDTSTKLAIKDDFFVEIEKLLLESFTDEVNEALEKLAFNLKRNEGTDIATIKNLYIRLYMLVDNIYCRLLPSESGKTGNKMWMKILELETLDEISEFLRGRLNNLTVFLNNAGSDHAIIVKIKNYIHKNYANDKLSLKQVSENIHLSLNYMCNMFKQKTGCTVNEYITRVRLEKAKELLTSAGIKSYEVSCRVGFKNPNYFARLYKKYYNISPSESREKLV